MEGNPASSLRIPVEERLFSLVLALLATESGLTKNEILETVQGYRQRYRPGGDNASLERQFERDKDDVRELGVPLETIDSPESSGNNQTLRYRIPPGEYDLPADVRFSPEEMTLLALAARVWRDGSLSAESRRATLKLRSLGVDAEDRLLGYAPRVNVIEGAFEPLRRASADHRVVRFDYLKPGQDHARTRTLAPLALVQHLGRWHVTGVDRDAAAPRTFLLSRIVGSVTTLDETFDPPGGDPAATALEELEAVWQRNVAVVATEPDTDAAVRLSNRPGSRRRADGTLEIHYSDPHILADTLAGFGPEALVLEPAQLREGVLARLRECARRHGGEVPDG